MRGGRDRLEKLEQRADKEQYRGHEDRRANDLPDSRGEYLEGGADVVDRRIKNLSDWYKSVAESHCGGEGSTTNDPGRDNLIKSE